MHTPQLSTKELDIAIAALGECYSVSTQPR